MIFAWKEFKINLYKFNKFLIDNIVEADGIATYEDHFKINIISELSIEKQQMIQNYYDNLDEATEASSLQSIPEVTPRQLKQALVLSGVSLSQIEEALNSLPEPQKSLARIDWESSIVFQRNRPLVAEVASMLGWTEEQLDDLWVLAGTL